MWTLANKKGIGMEFKMDLKLYGVNDQTSLQKLATLKK